MRAEEVRQDEKFEDNPELENPDEELFSGLESNDL